MLVISSDGTVIRLEVKDIGVYGRSTIGVRIINVKDGNKVASVAIMNPSDEEEEDDNVPRETLSEAPSTEKSMNTEDTNESSDDQE